MAENSVDLTRYAQAVKVLQWVQAEQKKLSDMAEAARSVIEDALGDNEIGVVGDRRVVTWKHGKTSRFNQKRLKTERPDIHFEYTDIDIPTRTFLIAESGET